LRLGGHHSPPPNPIHYCVSSVEPLSGETAYPDRTQRYASHGGNIRRPERTFALQTMPTLRPQASVLRQNTPVCRLWWGSPLKGALHTADYRGYGKWKEARAAIAKRAPVEGTKVCGAPSPTNDPKAKQADPTAE
jgi:hypothetical protein